MMIAEAKVAETPFQETPMGGNDKILAKLVKNYPTIEPQIVAAIYAEVGDSSSARKILDEIVSYVPDPNKRQPSKDYCVGQEYWEGLYQLCSDVLDDYLTSWGEPVAGKESVDRLKQDLIDWINKKFAFKRGSDEEESDGSSSDEDDEEEESKKGGIMVDEKKEKGKKFGKKSPKLSEAMEMRPEALFVPGKKGKRYVLYKEFKDMSADMEVLTKAFPAITRKIISDTYNSLGQDVELTKNFFSQDYTAKTVRLPKEKLTDQEKFARFDVKNLGKRSFHDWREAVEHHLNLYHCFVRLSICARKAGFKPAAKKLRYLGALNKELVAPKFMKASHAELIQNLQANLPVQERIDLHGLHACEAVPVTHEALVVIKNAIEQGVIKRSNKVFEGKQYFQLTIVTGRGSHSRGPSKLFPKVKNYLEGLRLLSHGNIWGGVVQALFPVGRE